MNLFWSMIQQGGIAPNPVWNGLQSYWRLDSTSGTTAYDAKSTINGTLNGAVTWVTGKNNNAASFNNNTSARITLGNVYGFERTDSWSISCWVKRITQGTGINAAIISKLNTSSPFNGWEFQFEGNKINFLLINNYSAPNRLHADTGILTWNTSLWYHIACTYNGSSKASGCTIYLNSTNEAPLTIISDTLTSTIVNSLNLNIGSRNATDGASSIIDEMGLWNRVLTQTEINTLYNSGAGLFY